MQLLSMVFGGVESALSGIADQFKTVQEQGIDPLKAIVQEVQGGAWKGDGADAFVKELEALAIPGIGQVGESINFFGNCVRQSVDIIQQADQAINGLVSSVLDDVFGFL